MTYQEIYTNWLERRIDAGGAPEAVDKAVSEFNAPTRAGFDAWLKDIGPLPCATCGESFEPENAAPPQEVLCKNHVPKLTIVKP